MFAGTLRGSLHSVLTRPRTNALSRTTHLKVVEQNLEVMVTIVLHIQTNKPGIECRIFGFDDLAAVDEQRQLVPQAIGPQVVLFRPTADSVAFAPDGQLVPFTVHDVFVDAGIAPRTNLQ